MRLEKKQLDEILKKEGCDRWWSWSRINCFHTSSYEYFLKYILHKKEDNANSIYVVTGGSSHDVLERYYTNEITYEEMIDEFEDGWVVATDIAQLKFDRTSEEKNETIKEKYYNNLVHFFKNHKTLEYKPTIEQFIKIKIGNNLFMGYLDCCFKDSDGNVHIVDFKTSSLYKGAKAENECGQLVLYAIGLHQMGLPYKSIKICWNFLKYCTIQYEQKNGAIKTRDVERSEIGKSLQSNAKTWLKEFGYDVDEYLKLLLDTNSIDCLPDKVKEKYVISDCYVYIDLTDKLINKWIDYINNTITDIKLREQDYKETGNEKIFWDTPESVKAQSYYFANLCSYSAAVHKPYAKYLNELENKKKGIDFFSGIGSSNDYEVSSSSTDEYNKQNEDDLDLSWLEELV